jgi:hypothetical protein
MSSKKSTVAADLESATASELAAAAFDAAAGHHAATAREDVLTLELADLVGDSNGEIVLFNDSHLPALALRTDSAPIEAGEMGSHVTAAGDDVTGYRYVAFNDGTKLIFQDSVDLVILGANGDLHG